MRNNTDFQTPPALCDHMAKMLWTVKDPRFPMTGRILEPTPGAGNLVAALKKEFPYATVTAPHNFWALWKLVTHKLPKDQPLPKHLKFDAVVMNPPFTPMVEAYTYLEHCMVISDHIVALMPWLTMINGEQRTKSIMDFGLVSITHIPRKAFKSKNSNARVQCCLLHMKKGYTGDTIFKTFEF